MNNDFVECPLCNSQEVECTRDCEHGLKGRQFECQDCGHEWEGDGLTKDEYNSLATMF